MFSNLLPISDVLFSVDYSSYAKTHFLKKFQKKYPGKQWELTDLSIRQDLSRLRMVNNNTQKGSQIDELRHCGDLWIAKYDFRIAGTKTSTKDSGNRCIVFINNAINKLQILMIYHKDDIPKVPKETEYIFNVIRNEYNYLEMFD